MSEAVSESRDGSAVSRLWRWLAFLGGLALATFGVIYASTSTDVDAVTRQPAQAAGMTRSLPSRSTLSPLPGDVLIADRLNNRLVIVSEGGHVVWSFPRPGDLPPGKRFRTPDDAFFSADGKRIVATQEANYAISVIDIASRRIVFEYGTSGVAGSSRNLLDNPDDAIALPNGDLLAADIKNCRLIILHPPRHAVVRQLGETGVCVHHPPAAFGSPNGAFPMASGATLVTEINGDWVDEISPTGHLVASSHVPGFSYPSDSNELRPGLELSADYTNPGAIETFDLHGRTRWRYAPTGAKALNHPSLALPLPNGDILANDDFNDRVIVIDPRTNQIVWQYGHTHAPGRAGLPEHP